MWEKGETIKQWMALAMLAACWFEGHGCEERTIRRWVVHVWSIVHASYADRYQSLLKGIKIFMLTTLNHPMALERGGTGAHNRSMMTAAQVRKG